ncbi:hypothetical protein OIU77_015469 [Salix suchowensis]|uniref:Rhodopsin n=1 Tax=Salix suchowensis TaxID=1278906 RepID=A0ABQ8ZHB8_9ROSI|nr:early nodulin [Salix suchowensis]KAJ6301164.1 hypothetical protein OIU77_015469 [Salix suchowensis]
MAQTDQRVIYGPAYQVNPPPPPPIGYPQGYYVAPPPIGYPSKDDFGYSSQHIPETKMRGSIEIQCCCFSWTRSS